MRRFNGILQLLVILAVSLVWLCNPANSSTDYPKRNIVIIVPYSPGGGFDTQARGIAPYLEKHLPNKVNVIIKNMPGAGGLVAAHHVWGSKPDGYKIYQSVVAGALISQYLNPKEVSYRMEKFEWIGQYQKDIRAVAVNPKLPIHNWKDLLEFSKKQPVLFGTPGLGSAPYKESKLISKITGIPIDLVNYPGSSACQAGMARGEIQAINLNFNSLMRWGDDCRIIFIWDDERHPMIPDIPTAVEAGFPKDAYRKIMDLPVIGTPRAFAVAPGTPQEILTVLRKAFMQAMNDPGYKAWIKKAKQIYGPIVSGENFTGKIQEMNQNARDNIQLIKSLSD